jgi:hypothetical protein
MRRWKRILVPLGIMVVTCVGYLWFFGTQTFFVLEAHNVARKLPFVKRTPVVLPNASVSQESGMNLSYFGYDFEVPWTDLDKEKTKIVGGNKVNIAFRSGKVLSVWSGQPHEFMDGVLKEANANRDDFRNFTAMKHWSRIITSNASSSKHAGQDYPTHQQPNGCESVGVAHAKRNLRPRRPKLWNFRCAGKGIQRISIRAPAEPSEPFERRTFS